MSDFRKHQPRRKNGKYANYTFVIKIMKWIIEKWKENLNCKQTS